MANVDIHLSNSISGLLSKGERHHSFTYRHDATEAISLSMPLRAESYSSHDLHPIFQMNLPEGALRQAIELAVAKRYGSDDLTMLTLLGSNQIGRIAYSAEGRALPEKGQSFPNLQQLISSDDSNLFEQLFKRYATHSGVAGVQPKILLDTVNSKATVPLHSYIVKSWWAEYPELACNEYFCLTLAKNAGLKVPDYYLSDNGKLLISKRFDLSEIGEPIGFEDFCVLQGKGTREKYDASLESCANTLRQYVSPQYQQQALYDFFKLTLVNIQIRNGDAHLKNSGILYHDLRHYKAGALPAQVREMAPCYDIISTVPYIVNDTMALSLTGSKRWPKLKVVQQFGRQHCLLNNNKMDQALNEVTQAAEKTLPLLTDLTDKHPGFSEISEKITVLIKVNNL